ncbi:aspartate/glutamate racemase family protein [Rhodoligotrophos defluvii]|uniref:aspartate/glutamate racemase family protein n=1 Tax=Rhodoligotrophos defluvii TaxID=2561934 RepID=UPI001EF0F40F|nr:aspartate/glutamate racemase family protein [Rhodoligotrophos defluvii]
MDRQTVYGKSLGVLVLETGFRRFPGDAGNLETWPFPVQYRIVAGARPLRVIDRQADGLLNAFIDAGRDLVRHGASAITTTCGFLAIFQRELAAALPVPVGTSSLLQVPLLQRLLPAGRTVGVLTMDPAQLTARHLRSVGIEGDVPMEGLPRDGAFWAMIADNRNTDAQVLEAEVLHAAERLLVRAPSVGALVLECANMPPYARSLAEHTGLPVYDIVSLCGWLMAGLVPPHYGHRLQERGRGSPR